MLAVALLIVMICSPLHLPWWAWAVLTAGALIDYVPRIPPRDKSGVIVRAK